MRKLLCLAVFLLFLGMPALAEEAPTVPDWAVGEWKAVLAINGAQMHTWTYKHAPRLLITEDGFLTAPDEGAPRFPLNYDAEAEDWYVSAPETGEKAFLDWSGYLASPQLTLGADANHLTCYIRANGASPVQLPYKLPAVSYCGDWVVTSFFPWSGTDSKTFFAEFWFDFEGMNTDPLTVTIPPFPTFDAIQQVWADAVSQTAADCPLRALQEIYGYELCSQYAMLLVTQHGLLTLWRVSSPELDPAFQDQVDDCVGWWYPDEISVGGIYLPASAMGIPDDPIAIDDQGNVLLPDGTVTALRLEEDTLLLGEYPVSGGFSLTLAEDVELDFLSEDDWCRRQLNGDWQLSSIEVPSLGLETSVDPAITDVTLNIDSNNWCYMDSDQYRLYDSYNPTEYQLKSYHSDDSYALTIVDTDTVQVTPDSGSYILTFTRIEETAE